MHRDLDDILAQYDTKRPRQVCMMNGRAFA